jgi:hypothetical protein
LKNENENEKQKNNLHFLALKHEKKIESMELSNRFVTQQADTAQKEEKGSF